VTGVTLLLDAVTVPSARSGGHEDRVLRDWASENRPPAPSWFGLPDTLVMTNVLWCQT
jgi:hypothetical protein